MAATSILGAAVTLASAAIGWAKDYWTAKQATAPTAQAAEVVNLEERIKKALLEAGKGKTSAYEALVAD